MPTEKPRITSYPSIALHGRLKEYQKAKKLKTLSKAVIAALEDYFEMLDNPEQEKIALAEIKQEIKNMRQKLDELSKKIEELEGDKLQTEQEE